VTVLDSLPIHPLLATRVSTRAFDPSGVVTPEQRRRLREAARCSPSAGNTQPWRFLVGHRGDPTHQAVFSTLSARNAVWAGNAAMLLLGVYDTGEDRPLAHAAYDLGQSVAHLTVQAAEEGLAVHQMGGFSAERAREAFGIPERYVPFVAVAVGPPGDPATLPEDLRVREATRRRKPLSEIAFSAWDVPLEL